MPDRSSDAGHATSLSEQHRQQLGLHAQPAAQLSSLADFAATPQVVAACQQQKRSQHAFQRQLLTQPGPPPAAMHFSTAAPAAPADGHAGGIAAAEAAGFGAAQGPISGGAAVRHPEQPAGATPAGANSWWDDDGCFEYRAPLSTTVRRLKASSCDHNTGCHVVNWICWGLYNAPRISLLSNGNAMLARRC